MNKIIIVELSLLCILLFPIFTFWDDEEQINYKIGFHLPQNNYKMSGITVTAYNVGKGNEAQTDESPCIGAGNHNICQALDEGKIVFAANFLPLHTKICVEKIGCGEVLDRMASRYSYRLDYAMPANKLKEAKQFGIKKLNYYCETN